MVWALQGGGLLLLPNIYCHGCGQELYDKEEASGVFTAAQNQLDTWNNASVSTFGLWLEVT